MEFVSLSRANRSEYSHLESTKEREDQLLLALEINLYEIADVSGEEAKVKFKT